MNSTFEVPFQSLPSSEAWGFLSLEAIEKLELEGDSTIITSYHVIRHFVTPAVCLISMGALIFTLIFLHRRKLVRITALIYLKLMGLIDLLSLVVLFISSLDYFMNSRHMKVYYTSAFAQSLHGCLFGLLLTSNWLMTAQAIERTIAISRPFKAKQIREKHRRIVVSVICVMSVLLTIPTLVLDIMLLTRYQTPAELDRSCIDDFDYATNLYKLANISTGARVHPYYRIIPQTQNQTQSDAVLNSLPIPEDTWPESLKLFQTLQAWVVHFIIFFILPFVFLCLASFYLLSAVRMSGRFIRQHCIRGGVEFRNTLREEARMTVLVLCLIGAFFICQSPFVAYSACYKVGFLSQPSRGHSLIRALTTLALALKSDCTFVFHCWLNQRFALALRHMLCSFSSNAVSGRCHGSKSYSQEDSQNAYNSRQGQTRYLIKHHAIQQSNRVNEKQMKILLKEIDFNRKAACHLNQNFKDVDEKKPKSTFSKVQIGFKELDMKRQSIPIEDVKQSEIVRGSLLRKGSTEGSLKEANRNPRMTVALGARELNDLNLDLSKRCCKKQSKFFSENDLFTSCTVTGCSCESSCQATSFCSSLECTAETSAQCKYSLTKSFSLPPPNSMSGPYYHVLSATCVEL